MTKSVAAAEIPAIIGTISSDGVVVILSIPPIVGEIEKGDEGGEAERGDDEGDEGEGDESGVGEIEGLEGVREGDERGDGGEGEGDEGGGGVGQTSNDDKLSRTHASSNAGRRRYRRFGNSWRHKQYCYLSDSN